MRGALRDLHYSRTGNQILLVEVQGDAREVFNEFVDVDCDITIKKHRERRSLDANNYSWVMTDKLADHMTLRGCPFTKDQMHAEMIFRYGQVMRDDDGKAVKIAVQHGIPIDELTTGSLHAYAKPLGSSEINGKVYDHYKLYRGSRDYDTREMAIFIDGIVSECREQGIETLSERELSLIKDGWGR